MAALLVRLSRTGGIHDLEFIACDREKILCIQVTVIDAEFVIGDGQHAVAMGAVFFLQLLRSKLSVGKDGMTVQVGFILTGTRKKFFCHDGFL